jgi:hypothetical protein
MVWPRVFGTQMRWQFLDAKPAIWLREMVHVNCSTKTDQSRQKKLCAFTFSERTTKRWHREHSLTPKPITSIAWDACEAAMGCLPFGRKLWLIKHATGF